MSCCETHLEFQTSYEFYKNFFMEIEILDGNLITIISTLIIILLTTGNLTFI